MATQGLFSVLAGHPDFLSRITGTIKEGVLLYNNKAEILFFNKSALHITGLTDKQLLDKNFLLNNSKLFDATDNSLVELKTALYSPKLFAIKREETRVFGFSCKGSPIKKIQVTFFPTSNAAALEKKLMLLFFKELSIGDACKEIKKKEVSIWDEIIHKAQSAVLVIDTKLNLIKANKSLATIVKLFNKNIELKEKTPLLNGINADRRSFIKSCLEKVLTGEHIEYENRITDNAGAEHWLFVSYMPIINKSQKVIGIIIIANDTTEARKNKSQKIEEDRKWKFILDNGKDGTWEFNFLTKESYYSPLYKSMLGYREEEFQNNYFEWINHIHPEDIPKVHAIDNLYTNQKIEYHELEYRLKTKNEGYMWVLDRGMVAERGKDGTPLKLVGTHKKIHDKKMAEEELRNSEQRFSSFMENTPTMNWIIDDNGIFHYLNKMCIDHFGLPNDVIGRPVEELLPAPAAAIFLHQNIISWNADESTERIEACEGKEGAKNLYQVFAFPLTRVNGVKLIGAVALDITKKLLMEEQIADEYKKNKRETIRAIINSQERDRQNFAEELHDNANQILSSAKLLLEASIAKPRIEKNFVEKSLEYLNEAILEIRKISHSLAPAILRDISLDAAIEEHIQIINSSGKLNVTYENTGGENIELSMIPEKKLAILRIAQEQLTNVIKHSGATMVIVTLTASSTSVNLVIEDNGCGFNVGTAKKGFGLANIYNRAEYYHANLVLHSFPGKGTSLRLEMPVA